ncbi:MJ0042-type zinc finger domain-containing protein [Neisseria yangbaofengii]|uniref:MJ0042-type zinc finger domain-containing protein n=1 Tax=Neisseria yangbaofengii TaxID=2709396 RepID=UPI0013EC7A48|nr:MJ0042-type zinc finger domain-containing protein [Neisseria yangbaofengii]
MPACTCPHCRTHLWVKDAQLNVAQGFVVCQKCEGLFKAKDHPANLKEQFQPEALPNAVTDVRLVHNIGAQVRQHKQLSRNEIADLLDGVTLAPKPDTKAATAVEKKKDGFNWTLASLIALTVLIMQLFYLILLA